MLDYNRIAYELDSLDEWDTPEPPRSNAPVTRAVWSATGLPDGLTLSPNGLLIGQPTTAGSYDVKLTLTTNWGTHTNILRIIVS